MARRVVNRRELREANDAAEALDREEEEEEEEAVGEEEELEGESEEVEEKPKKKKKAPAKRKSKSKTTTEARMKLYWGVFSQAAKRVAIFEFDQKEEAEKRAEELSKGGKSPHFVQKVKEQIGEA